MFARLSSSPPNNPFIVFSTPPQGLEAMFFMMNEMRIHVGMGASICGIRGYQESLNYAVERKQGKAGEIINYPDVKRQVST